MSSSMRRSRFDRPLTAEEHDQSVAPLKGKGAYDGPPYLTKHSGVTVFRPTVGEWGQDGVLKAHMTVGRFIPNTANFNFSYPTRVHYFGDGKNKSTILCPRTATGTPQERSCIVCETASKLWNKGDEGSKVLAKPLFGKDMWLCWFFVRDPENTGYKDPQLLPITSGKNIDTLSSLLKGPDGTLKRSIINTRAARDVYFQKHKESPKIQFATMNNWKLDEEDTPLHPDPDVVEKILAFVEEHPFHDEKLEDGRIAPGILRYLTDEELEAYTFGDHSSSREEHQPSNVINISNAAPVAVKQEVKPESVETKTPPATEAATPASKPLAAAATPTPEYLAKLKENMSKIKK